MTVCVCVNMIVVVCVGDGAHGLRLRLRKREERETMRDEKMGCSVCNECVSVCVSANECIAGVAQARLPIGQRRRTNADDGKCSSFV